MLSVKEAIEMRRSIRHFGPDDVPNELIRQMLEAARLAPSASNRQPWRFLVVRDKEIKKELRRICLEQRFVEEAPVVIVCFGDSEYGAHQELPRSTIPNTFIAIEHLVLMATALGLGTCWVGAFDAPALNRLFGLSDNLIPAAVIPAGYAAGEIPTQRPRRSLQEILLKP